MTRFHIANMTCGHCKASVEKAVTALDDDAELDFDMETREVEIDSTASKSAILSALDAAGYPAAEI
ncbi:heavy-metal-associated domain-containing protein (plasmid) [Marivivens sp. LCG002]|uniref:heavy-metal-associated domain-containing protein n=1 Tax=Marivivens sp. LCG002 TaxID=3051171 RepID=UPI002552B35B|nr:heavy-metal-associated domain-containing protein [Marivivens sp. LCG002]WIV52419.1 heavy-metal-associated domain-containing protein [Marivivens sp. LCG002]